MFKKINLKIGKPIHSIDENRPQKEVKQIHIRFKTKMK